MARTIGIFTRARLVQAVATTAMACALSAAPAFAAEAADAPPADAAEHGLKEIVVTAQFRSQKLQDTPLSITAVTSDLLKSRNQTDISQIAAQAPNVQLTQMGGAFGSSMAAYIRGVGQYDFNPAYEPGVGIYIDDVYYASLTGSVMDLLDLDRVEVLRGPQGTLTGRNSIGGAIKMFSTKPSAENSGNIEAAYGARNRLDLRGSMNFALTDSLFVRVSGVHKRQDGYVNMIDYGCANPGNSLGITGNPNTGKGCVIGKLGEKNYTGARASIRYNPNDKLDWIVSGDYTYENRSNAASVLTVDNTAKTGGVDFRCGNFCTYANFYMPAGGQAGQAYTMPMNTMFTGWGVSSNLKYTLSDNLNLQSITAYRKYHQTFGTDDDFTPYGPIGGAGYNDLTFRFFSQELRLNGKIGSLAEWTIGGFYNDQTSVYFTRQDIRYIVPNVPSFYLQFQGNDPVKANSKAGFATLILHPTSKLNVTAGLRYTSEHKDYTFVRQNWSGGALVDPFGVGALNGSVANYDGNKLDWRISADYRFSPQLMAYATVSTGFKGGGVTARPFTKTQATNGTFRPETLTSYELGLKSDLFDRRLRLNLAGFVNDYKNIQLPISDCSLLDGFAPGTDPYPCAAIQNAGDGKMWGLEGELSATPIDGLNIDATLSWIDGEWNRISAQVTSIKLSDPITSPNWRGSAGIQYTADLGGSNGTLTPRFDLVYTGKQQIGRLTVTSPLDYNPAFALANARLTWKNPKQDLAISFEVSNLFDKYYYLPLRFQALYASAGTVYSNVGRPREWAISVRKSF
ncbi:MULTISPECIES: TonB-dependent receptor [unclassified Novosphingobium]|uniref:TonB-dependent receptor n=1 Tax=unclassified Novosphingobium TaxID=2644732 RepID=UPI000959B1B5|nr:MULTISPECIES: TonB-dependent receptor [unclassified Novosphingobium]MBN9144960.1 TonB-dependent receptor [Novosphingobium sp.]MDR6708881.1 iron complex outermembrane receptor protein [Novosphingobium sp. 1748]NKJ01986.1 iron complex outermembrane receptor protein [Novosphingobium sp. SG707]OJX90011.1 MAG: TonB-dependent receptor [Novosphingobium sp. 63-713]